MGIRKRLFVVAVSCLGLLADVASAQDASGPSTPPPQAWVPKKARLTSYTLPNKPIWRLSEILASHSKTGSWEQPIVRNKELWADYIQLAAGSRTPRLMYPDNRVGMIVWDGDIRVTVDGQEPFIATKGFEINIPYRTAYTMEAVGTKPGLYFFVREADHNPQYPVETHADKPADLPGYVYTKVIYTANKGSIDPGQKLYLDYYKDVVAPNRRGGAFIASDHFFMNNIRGMGVPTPPASNLGHFHAEYTEFWFILEGKMDYLIEGIPDVIRADAGDVVTAAQGRFHRASFQAGQMDTRVAINPFPQGQHNFTPASGGTQ